MDYLAVKDFADFQHYRDRNPPWIKLYGTVLSDVKFLQLPEAAQAQLIKLWILASQMGNPLPNNPKLLAGRIGVIGKFHLAAIMASGFLVPCNENASTDASGALANCEQNAGASVRGRNQRSEVELEDVGDERRELNRGSEHEPETLIGEPELNALYLTIWANKAVGDRWGEQPNPYIQANAITLADELASAGVEWQTAKASIYHQCRESKQPRPPRAQNYFRRGVLEAWEHERARREAARSSEQAPADGPRLERNGAKPNGRGALMFAKIRELIEVREVAGQPPSRFIKKDRVVALGPDVLRAYEVLGGAEKFLSTPKDKLTFLQRDFSEVLEAYDASA